MKTIYKIIFSLLITISLVTMSIGADFVLSKITIDKKEIETISEDINIKYEPIIKDLSSLETSCNEEEGSCTYTTTYNDEQISYSLSINEVNSLSKEDLTNRLMYYFESYINSNKRTDTISVDVVKAQEPVAIIEYAKEKAALIQEEQIIEIKK